MVLDINLPLFNQYVTIPTQNYHASRSCQAEAKLLHVVLLRDAVQLTVCQDSSYRNRRKRDET